MAAVSLVVVLASAAVIGAAFAAAGRTVPVLVVVRPVSVGSTLTTGDLGVASVHVPSGVATVAAASEAGVLGRSATQRLLPGTLLGQGDVSAGTAIPPGDALVGVAVTDAQMPVGGLLPGGRVDVVATASPGSPAALAPTATGSIAATGSPTVTGSPASGGSTSAPVGAVVVSGASVADVVAASASGAGPTTAVTIVVPVAEAPVVAQLSAAGQAAIVAVPAGS